MEQLTFEDLRLAYKPYLRPKGLEAMIQAAFSINPRHREEFLALKRLFHALGETVADDLIRFLLAHAGLDARFGTGDMNRVRGLLVAHLRNVVSGRFDAAYLSTLEDFALLLARHNASLLWVTGAYHDLSTAFMDRIVTDEVMNNAVLRRHAYRALSTWIAIETCQISRVLTEYARLLRHEARSGTRPALPDQPPEGGSPDSDPPLAERLRLVAAGVLRPD